MLRELSFKLQTLRFEHRTLSFLAIELEQKTVFYPILVTSKLLQ